MLGQADDELAALEREVVPLSRVCLLTILFLL
jgi:hypothetical protein